MTDESVGEATVIRVAGEVDVSTSPLLREVVDRAVRSHRDGRIVIDLRGVSFMDSAGLHVLLNAHRRLHHQGRRCLVVCQDGPVYRLFELSRLIETFSVRPTLGDALND